MPEGTISNSWSDGRSGAIILKIKHETRRFDDIVFAEIEILD